MKKERKTYVFDFLFWLTSGNDGLKACPVDECTLYCLSFNVRPINPFLKSVIIHHSDIINVRNRQSSHDIHVWIINVHATDLRSPHIQQELLQGWCKKINIYIYTYNTSSRKLKLIHTFVWGTLLTHTRAVVEGELHEMRTRTGCRAIIINETKVGARTSSIVSFARVWGWKTQGDTHLNQGKKT